uniref:Uncharacterized protein n=1 Tax=Panagrolaimus davidi TaxID=227884 RepID=A0A914PXN7_9BILA
MMSVIHFKESNVKQYFTLPSTIISYICQNPIPTKKFLEKLYSTCKYFYPKVKIISLATLRFPSFGTNFSMCWALFESRYPAVKYLPKSEIYLIDFKLLCVNTIFEVHAKSEEERKLLSYLITKVRFCQGCYFDIGDQILTLNEYKKLAEISEGIFLKNVTILRPDGTLPPVEELLNIAICVKHFELLDRLFNKNFI